MYREQLSRSNESLGSAAAAGTTNRMENGSAVLAAANSTNGAAAAASAAINADADSVGDRSCVVARASSSHDVPLLEVPTAAAAGSMNGEEEDEEELTTCENVTEL